VIQETRSCVRLPGHHRQPDDSRNELVFEFMRIVCEIHPRSFCMENVPGMLDMHTCDGVPVIDALALMAQEGGSGASVGEARGLVVCSGDGVTARMSRIALISERACRGPIR
jgi:site-specific DNA-cytosine methylase